MPSATDPGPRAAIARRLLLALIAALAAWAFFVALTGGFDLRPRGIPFRSTEVDRPALAALILAAIYARLFRRDAERHVTALGLRLRAVARVLQQHAAVVAAALAAVIFVLGMTHGIHVAGGSDSYGYISQANLWLARDLVVEQPIATQVPWPDAQSTFAPLAYRPALAPGAIVPVYPPGLSLLMALATILTGTCGPYLVVPLFGALMIWLTFRLGTTAWSPIAGLLAAALMATSPTFLFMLMNPMSDVPVSATWLAAIVFALSPSRWRSVSAGVAVSLAILIRPNLAPIGALFLWLLIARARREERWRTLLEFGVGAAPLVVLLAAVNAHLYGAPWKSGYGTLEGFYAWSYIVGNLRQYPAWLLRAETPMVALFVIPLIGLRRHEPSRRVVLVFLVLFGAAVWASYLFYFPFDAWWYLRFLLPAFPVMCALAAAGFIVAVTRIRGAEVAMAVGAVLLVAVFAARAQFIRSEGILTLWRGGVSYLSAAEFVRARLPENAVILTVQQSGSIRFYTDRLTLRWDLLDAAWWPRALDVLTEKGYRPYLLVAGYEEAQLRERFGLTAAAAAPGAVVAQMDAPETIRIYDPLRQISGAPAQIRAVVPCPCGAYR